MPGSARPNATAADLLRLLACWLALLLVVQCAAAAWALGKGPLHHHRAASADVAAAPAHRHDAGERHHHAADDASVLRAAGPLAELDGGAFALTNAMALLVATRLVAPRAAEERRHVLRAPTVARPPDAAARSWWRPPRRG